MINSRLLKGVNDCLKSIIVPFVSCILCTGIKIIAWGGQTSIEMFVSSDIAFSVAMYFFVYLIYIKKSKYATVKNELFMPYLMALIIFMILYGISVYEVSIIEYRTSIIGNEYKIGNYMQITSEPQLHIIRWVTILASCVAIFLAEIARIRYKLEVF
ncbi:MAG: hypothetical protein FWC09_04480 [Lachnospiraceae bacterium]|nr:hypothetical protein [Lachnospiraceae bacterium]